MLKNVMGLFLPLFAILFVSGCITDNADNFQSRSEEREIRKLLGNINENFDPLHYDLTPAVKRLIKIGEPALGPTLSYTLSSSADTRMRACRVVESVTETLMYPGKLNWTDSERKRFEKFWDSLGGLDPDASLANRKNSVKLWREWLAKGGSKHGFVVD